MEISVLEGQEKACAFALGYSAFSQGFGLNQQPYRCHLRLAEAWMRGWRVAELRQFKLTGLAT